MHRTLSADCLRTTARRLFAIAALATMGALVLTPAQAALLYLQGFETSTGDWTADPGGSIARTPSGGGTLGVPAFHGSYYGEVTNAEDAYQPGYGNGGYSFLGNTAPTPYIGTFSQSMAVYIDVTTPSPKVGHEGFWIDASPYLTDGTLGYGAEHNFHVSYDGSSVSVSVDAGGSIASITSSGWYDFSMTYRKGATATDLVLTDMKVFDAIGTLVGSTTVQATSPGGPVQSQFLAGPGYEWLTLWQNGFSGDKLAIDDIRVDSVAAPEPATLALLGAGLAGVFATRRRRRKA